MSPSLAFVFPGQGSQRAGMAADFHQCYREAREVFAEASDVLGFDLARFCFEGDERLDRTEFAQPAILAAEIAMLRVLTGPLGLAPDRFGGHSLGEYSALVAAGVIEFGEGLRLVRQRGRLMQQAMPIGGGGMTAVVARVIDGERLQAALEPLPVDVANFNSPGQVVLSGRLEDLDTAVERLRAQPEFERARFIPLRVSAPFHSRWMRPAEEGLTPLLEQAAAVWRAESATTVASNVSGGFHAPESRSVAAALARQVSAPVRWLDNMRALAEGSERIVEVGPGRPLAGFFKSVGRAVESVADVASAESVARAPQAR